MSTETVRDPRVTLVREKYFGLRPKPLERWFWDAKAPGSAERVYWYHWDIGHQNGTWVSQVPIRVVAQECALDVATITRAYQWLKGRGLLRRVDAGRDDANPFRQATSLTEVYVPRDLVQRLSASPNRRSRAAPVYPAAEETIQAVAIPAPSATPAGIAPALVVPAEASKVYSRTESQQIFRKLSETERRQFYAAQKARLPSMEFAQDSALTPAQQAHIEQTLALLAVPTVSAAPAPRASVARPTAATVPKGKLTLLQLVDLRSKLQRAKGEGDDRNLTALTQEIAWSIERGSLARFERGHAIAIACKKVRVGDWSTPFGMPAQWEVRTTGAGLCAGAGEY